MSLTASLYAQTPPAINLYREQYAFLKVAPHALNVTALAKDWGVSRNTVAGALHLAKNNAPMPEAAEKSPEPYEPTGADIFIKPDAHAAPRDFHTELPFQRFHAMGLAIVLAAKEARDAGRKLIVMDLGDGGEFRSLNWHTRNERNYNEQSLRLDMDAFIEQVRIITAYVDRARAAGCIIDLYYCEGNHEARVTKLLKNEGGRILEGNIELPCDVMTSFGWDSKEYRDPHVVEGWLFIHDYPSGVMGKGIGGVNMGRNMVTKVGRSIAVGHSHTWDVSSWGDMTGRKIHALACGVWWDFSPDFAQCHLWDRSFTRLIDVKDGDMEEYRKVSLKSTLLLLDGATLEACNGV